jgi:hypothetical protein
MAGKFRFTFGPWNIHEGADPFGPTVRKPVEFGEKLAMFKNLGFDGVQFHDDDALPNMNVTPQQMVNRAFELRKILDDNGLIAEFVAPRLWEDPGTIDGGYTSNDSNSWEVFLKLLEISRNLDESYVEKCIDERDYEELDLFIIKSLLK